MKVLVAGQSIDVQTSLADRIVGFFSPAAQLGRLRARTMLALAGGYQSGRRDRRAMRNWRPRGSSANADILPDVGDLRARSRDLVRNVPLATGAVGTVVTNVVGDGLSLRSRIDRDILGMEEDAAAAWQRAAEREWMLFAERCDFSGEQSHEELQALAFRAALESGDVLVIRRYRKDAGDVYGTKIQIVEADRVCNRDRQPDGPERVAGVQIGADGVAAGYDVASRNPDEILVGAGASMPVAWATVPRRDGDGRPVAFLLFERVRPDQARGVPYLAPVIETLKTLGDYADYEVRAALITAMFSIFVENGETTDPDDTPALGTADAASIDNAENELAVEDAGAYVELAPGQTVKMGAPGRPNPAFDGFVIALSRHIGAALGIGHELLIRHFTASYSASRAALEMAWQFFRVRRSWLAWRFCQPSYEWCIEEAVASGRLAAPGFFADPIVRQAYLGAEWRGPARPNLDPLKEANADKTDIEMNVKTREQVIDERTGGTGGSFEQTVAQLTRENAALKAAGIAAAPTSAAAPAQAPSDAQDQQDQQT